MGKQTRMEGKEFESNVPPELLQAASALREVRLERIALQQREKELASALIATMEEKGCSRFVVTDYDPPFYAKLRPGKSKVEVRALPSESAADDAAEAEAAE